MRRTTALCEGQLHYVKDNCIIRRKRALCEGQLHSVKDTGLIPISLLLLGTGTVLRKAAMDRGLRLATGRFGCRQINKPSNSTVSVLI